MTADPAVERRRAEATDLDGALAELWREIEASESTPLSRALTVNFIAVTSATDEAELLAAGQRLLLRHPCRAFVVVLDDAGEDVAAELTASVRQVGSARQTVLEQIRLSTPLRTFSKIPGLIRPLIVSDLPVHLFWGTALPQRDWDLTTMARLADQTIVDSSRFARPIDDLQRLGDLVKGSVDLAFFRLRPWRRALAEAFENFAWQPREFGTRARIVHGSAPGAVAAAYRLSRWLRRRLAAEVEQHETADDAPLAEPLRLELWHGEVHVEIEHSMTAAPVLRTLLTLADQCRLPTETVASRGQLGDLLGAAVDGL